MFVVWLLYLLLLNSFAWPCLVPTLQNLRTLARTGNQKNVAQYGYVRKMDILSPSRDLSTQHFYAVSDGGPVAVRPARGVAHAFLVAAAAAIAAAIGRVNLIKETSRIFGYAGKVLIFISLLPSPFPSLQFTPPHRGAEGQIFGGILSLER